MLKVNPIRKVLIKFGHGLGDNVQLCIPLQHIKKYKPYWTVDLCVREGRKRLLAGHCRTIYTYNDHIDEKYDWVYENFVVNEVQLGQYVRHMQLPKFNLPDLPQSWPVHFLADVCDITPDPNLFNYHLNVDPASELHIDAFIRQFNKFATIHCNGMTNTYLTYFGHRQILDVCDLFLKHGITPVIIDFDHVCSVPDNKRIFRADMPMESGCLVALIKKSQFFIGLDSGPLHVAGGVGVPAIGLWEQTSPQYLYGFNQNVTHYRPQGFGKICTAYKTTTNYFKTLREHLERNAHENSNH